MIDGWMIPIKQKAYEKIQPKIRERKNNQFGD